MVIVPTTGLDREGMSRRAVLGFGAAFRFGLDAGKRGADGSFPGLSDLAAPPLAGDPEVGAQFPGIRQSGDAVVLGERELLGHVWHGPAHQLETDPVRPVESD